ncbi:hypothetical protein QQF64_005079 [Cirrhinus molitorella]|uniref:U1-type domain-containing protein n=1 Tax=Cirrhinus molitorella TaxID=172907 RepID=A0ABR3MI17_9TELE
MAHGGRNDVCQHEKSAKHKRGLEAQKRAQEMSAFVMRNATEADQVTSAESLLRERRTCGVECVRDVDADPSSFRGLFLSFSLTEDYLIEFPRMQREVESCRWDETFSGWLPVVSTLVYAAPSSLSPPCFDLWL